MVWDSVQLWGRERIEGSGMRSVWSAGLPMGCAGPAGRLQGAHKAQHNMCLLLLPLAFSDQWKASPVLLEPDSWGLALEERVLGLGSWDNEEGKLPWVFCRMFVLKAHLLTLMQSTALKSFWNRKKQEFGAPQKCPCVRDCSRGAVLAQCLTWYAFKWQNSEFTRVA